MHLLDRWIELSPSRRWLLVQAAVAVPIATALVWSLGTSRARDVMPRLPWRLLASDDIGDVGWAVEAVGRRMPTARCLVRAVAAEAILDRAGRQPEMHIGARRSDRGQLEAHAWVEAEGRVVVGAEERAEFARLDPPPGMAT
jgi:Transglutaminase-like superfamily